MKEIIDFTARHIISDFANAGHSEQERLNIITERLTLLADVVTLSNDALLMVKLVGIKEKHKDTITSELLDSIVSKICPAIPSQHVNK